MNNVFSFNQPESLSPNTEPDPLFSLTPGPNTRYNDVAQRVTGQTADKIASESYRQLGRSQAQLRHEKRQRIDTLEQWKTGHDQLTQAYCKSLGFQTPPEPPKVQVQERGCIRTPDLEIHKLLFSSLPGHWVTANLYLPRHRNPGVKLPALISACGHAEQGKANFTQRGAFFAVNGYATLIYDPAGQGERKIIHPAAASVEHNCIGSRMILAGYNLAWMLISDNMAAVSVLQQHQAVDPQRIGMTGSSGGGWLTIHASALDERIKVVAPAAAVRSYREVIDADDAEQTLFDMLAQGLDFPDLIGLLVCPRPVMVIANEKDIWPIQSTQYAFDEAKRFYQMHGRTDLLQMRQWDRGHKFEPDQQAHAVRWFHSHLIKQPDRPLVENQTIDSRNFLKPEQTHVTDQGRLYDDSSMLTPNRVLWNHVKQTIPAEPDVEGLLKAWREKIDLRHRTGQPRWTLVSPFELPGAIEGRRLAMVSDPGVVLPVDMACPREAKEALIVVDEAGRRGNLYRTVAAIGRGSAVYRPDLRGLGETTPPDDWSDKESLASALYSGKQRCLHALALMVGRDLVLDRAKDLMATIDLAGELTPGLPIHLHASGDALVMAAVVTAALDARVQTLTLAHHVNRLTDVMACDTPLLDGSSFIHGLLAWGVDLPDLLAACPCKIQSESVHDAMLRPRE